MSMCTKCGQELGAGAKFCKACGYGLPKQGSGGMEDKKSRVTATERNWFKISALTAAAVFVVLAAVVIFGLYGKKPETAKIRMPAEAHAGSRKAVAYARVQQEDGSIRIPLSELDGGSARFFVYPAAGKEVKFFLLRMPDGNVRVALDACNACYRAKLGYRQEGDLFVCNNCGMSFRKEDVGIVTGGCNPIPVPRKMEGQFVIVKAKDLESGAKYF